MTWINALLLLALAVGHTELVVAVVNRLHALPFRCGVLRRVRHLHDLLVPAFPIILAWFVGIRGPGLLVGGSWRNLSPAWAIYLTACGAAAVTLLIGCLLRALPRFTPVMKRPATRVVDIAERLGFAPKTPVKSRWVARVPGNELFRLQVSERSFKLPRLPAEWDGLSILHLSDLHFRGTPSLPYFEEVAALSAELSADMVVFTGDLLDDTRLMNWLPSTLGRLSAPLGCYFVLGNHDWYLGAEPIRRSLSRLGWQDVAGRCHTISHRDRTMLVAGTERPWMGTHPRLPVPSTDDFRLLLSHTPDNLSWSRRERFDLVLAGHNHGGQVKLPLVGPVYSPSLYGCRYAAGAFWKPPTLLHVSRGVSGRIPLRLNCLPEITLLVLRVTEGTTLDSASQLATAAE